MSVRLSTSLPRACSGLMYPGVPTICPATDSTPVTVANCERSWISLRPPDRFRQTEVQHFHRALGRDLYIGWFQVAVNDSFVVRRFQCRRHLACAVQRGLNRERTAQHFALHQFHDQTIRLLGLLQSINRGNVGVVQGSQRARFAAEAR